MHNLLDKQKYQVAKFEGSACIPPLTRRTACFHSSCANVGLRVHSRPQARFHLFAARHSSEDGSRGTLVSLWTGICSSLCLLEMKSSLRLDEILLTQVEIHPAGGRNLRALPANDEARNPFGLRASFTLAAIYSRGTCRPTRRPRARRAASQTAAAVCPRSAGVRARGAGPKQPE